MDSVDLYDCVGFIKFYHNLWLLRNYSKSELTSQ